MTMTIQNIFRAVMPPGHSFSEARRLVSMSGVKFNGEQVTSLTQEVEVKNGDTFQVGKKNRWIRKRNGTWVKMLDFEKIVFDRDNPQWNDDSIQFVRLISEITATQSNLDMQALADSMDLEIADVDEIFERAHEAWEKAKKEHCP